jgi:hypothetical protein
MKTEARGPACVGEGERRPGPRGANAVVASPPAEFVYDNGQILLELLRSRAAEEERRRFVTGLRRLGGFTRPPDDL